VYNLHETTATIAEFWGGSRLAPTENQNGPSCPPAPVHHSSLPWTHLLSLAQVCSPTAQAKAATAQVQRRKWKCSCRDSDVEFAVSCVIMSNRVGDMEFSSAPSGHPLRFRKSTSAIRRSRFGLSGFRKRKRSISP
jgi:hypothetical protein